MSEETPDISTDEKALEYVINALKSNPSEKYFKWEPYSEDRRFIYREAKPDGEMYDEPPTWVHLCNPMSMASALVDKAPERTVAHSGYVRGGECIRCNAEFLPPVLEEEVEKPEVRGNIEVEQLREEVERLEAKNEKVRAEMLTPLMADNARLRERVKELEQELHGLNHGGLSR